MKEHADAPIFASLVARIGGVVTTLPIAVLGLSGFTVTLENFLYIMFYGVVILTLSNFAYYKAVAMAETHLINAVWYVTPVLSIIWLTLLGFGYINEWVGVGAAFVIVANIMLHLAAARRHSFRFTISWILIVGTILAVTPGLTHTDHYFDPIAALLVFFALLHGFAASRLDTCVTTERKLAVEIVRSREISQLPKEKLLALREAVADLPKATSERGYDHLNAILDDANIKGRTLQKIEEIVLSRAQRLAVGELFVLLIIGGTIVLLSIMTRPSGWIYNAFALIATTGVAFTLLTLVDQLADRARPIFELRDSADQKKKIVISPSLLSTESLAERALVASLAISLIAVYLAIFFFFE